MTDHNDEAMELQLDALLHEAMGRAPAPGLAERIGLRLQTAGRTARRARLWAAAVLVAGTGVVAAVAWSARPAAVAPDDAAAHEPAPQNPQPSPPQDPAPTNPTPPAPVQDTGMLLDLLLRDAIEHDRRDAVASIVARLSADEGGRLLEELTRRRLETKASRMVSGLLRQHLRATATPQDGRNDKAVLDAVRALEHESTRAGALAQLEQSVQVALPILFRVLQEEKQSVFERKELRAVLEDAHQRLYARWSGIVADSKPAARGPTWIADYSENKILELDGEGRTSRQFDEVFGAWDVEPLANGNLLVTEFSLSRVSEIDAKQAVVWSFEDLKNPYDADRLPNGNTLIADTFGSRVIEVDSKGAIVWSYAEDIRPFDCDRLENGDTLIADMLRDRVLQVSNSGRIVWQRGGMNNVHDADRLPNGGTLITLRSRGTVLEIDRQGRTIWELTGLSSPSDADRLPDGNTLVAENTRVAEYDPRGVMVWKRDTTWAVEACRR